MTDNDQIPGAEVATTAAELPSADVSPPAEITAAQHRVSAVAEALREGYVKASTLQLTPEEAKALGEDFPDEAFSRGAGGDDRLIYISHAYLRQRLNQVLGVGAAVPIRRREWAEDFTYFKDGRTKKGVRVYADLVLLVRGCVVGEAIGDAVYYPDNAKTNYSDALESAKSAAMRRCCKEFGVGLQAWMKGWCEGWEARNRPGRPAVSSSGTPPPERATAPAQQAPRPTVEGRNPGEIIVPGVRIISVKEVDSKPDAKKKWHAYFVKFHDGNEAGTFDRTVGEIAKNSTASQIWTVTIRPARNDKMELVALVCEGQTGETGPEESYDHDDNPY